VPPPSRSSDLAATARYSAQTYAVILLRDWLPVSFKPERSDVHEGRLRLGEGAGDEEGSVHSEVIHDGTMGVPEVQPVGG